MMFVVSLGWTNKNNFLVAYCTAGFKSFKAFASFKIFIQIIQQGFLVFLHLLGTQVTLLPFSSTFPAVYSQEF